MLSHTTGSFEAVVLVMLAGLMVFALLNVSSPLLHLSKLASCLDQNLAKTITFVAFGLVFFITRCLAFNYVVIKS